MKKLLKTALCALALTVFTAGAALAEDKAPAPAPGTTTATTTTTTDSKKKDEKKTDDKAPAGNTAAPKK